jgi:hypothetical protein
MNELTILGASNGEIKVGTSKAQSEKCGLERGQHSVISALIP